MTTATRETSDAPEDDSTKQRRRRNLACPKCNATFGRVDHLTRHVKSHEARKQYQCPCGSQFSRNDVLARHIRQCPQGGLEGTRPSNERPKQTRNKKACNRCARSKLKCDSKKPCGNCQLRSHTCQYTRDGYSDPFDAYRISRIEQNIATIEDSSDTTSHSPETTGHGSSSGSVSGTRGAEQTISYHAAETTSSMTDSFQHNSTTLDPVTGEELSSPPLSYQAPSTEDGRFSGHLPSDSLSGTGPDAANLWNFPLGTEDWAPLDDNMALTPPGTDDHTGQTVFSSWPADQASCSLGYDMDAIFQSDLLSDIYNPAHSNFMPSSSRPFLFDPEPSLSADAFLLRQLDPVEAKCVELRHLIQTSWDGSIDASFVTRENLISYTGLFAKHFSSNVSVLHLPTFSLVDTSPILLLAIILVGACYSSNISPPTIHDYAMKLLHLIENQPHERDMERPPLPIIQASVMLCSVLVCASDEKAFKFVTMYHARNLSMAERAGLFDSNDSVDFGCLTEENFDWRQWIEEETRRRLGCQIFCHDIGRCIFMKRRPSLDPLAIDVELPNYRTCWKASTAAECLHHLRRHRAPPRLSEAVKRVRTGISTNEPSLHASTMGMFVVIIALHGLVFQAIQEDAKSLQKDASSAYKMTKSAFSLPGSSIPAMANEMVSKYGSETTRFINKALDNWRASWDWRGSEDSEQENYTFSGDPLRFWWLAKLYLLNNLHQGPSHEDIESTSTAPVVATDSQKRLKFQSRIVSWLLQCRQEGCQPEPPVQGSLLCRMMKQSDVSVIESTPSLLQGR